MRYAAVLTAVFGSAMILVPVSHASATDAHFTQNISKNQSISKLISSVTGSSLSDQQATTVKPKARPTATLASSPKQTVAPAPAPVMVAVNSGDTLTAIADAHTTTTQRIFDANPALENPNVITVGQQLRMPAADEQLAARPMPAAPAVAVSTTSATTARATGSSYAASAAALSGGSVWDSLAQCESSGNWSINTGNGFYGGLQFTLATWQGLGGAGLPSQASREEQIARAEALQARSGWGQWPACAAKLGLL